MSYQDVAAKRISLSKIFRDIADAPVVYIGERQRDLEAEQLSEKMLSERFPKVNVLTAPDGAKLIPITEVPKLNEVLETRAAEQGRQSYASGHASGLEEGLVEARNVLKRFESAIADNVSQRQAMLDEAKAHILELVIQISKKVTFDAIQIDREATATMISNIIAELTDRTTLKIKVNPEFLPVVEQHMATYLSQSTEIKDLTFEADPRVKMGGCFIETPSGDVDARIESQFAVIADVIADDNEQS